ncbi:MAG TPA: CRISPR-associated helicase Cas3' [Armatimonadota bacterium]|jgi:CRISPR-associated endonuclease/helicase Cas3
MPKPRFAAHTPNDDGRWQTLEDHLREVSELCRKFGEPLGFGETAAWMGRLHDIGKASDGFQDYLTRCDAAMHGGPPPPPHGPDHSTAGAQRIWSERGDSPFRHLACEIIALCIASHHSGLVDSVAPDGVDILSKRLAKPTEPAGDGFDGGILENLIRPLESSTMVDEFRERLEQVLDGTQPQLVRDFNLGFLTRFLFSGLIDADRLNSAGRKPLPKPQWPHLVDVLEANLRSLSGDRQIDEIRSGVSLSCLEFAKRENGIYQLTVPTGGGKTLASLRFALHHADRCQMDRIVYVVPYTSIIDQNARVARSVFAFLENRGETIVLEHHSNLTPERETRQNKLLSENWDAPIIFTTAVQLLEALFAGGTRGVRRLHQLANSIIVFDEIQTIPIRTVHLFNNAINFLARQCGSTVVFCTATQPLLDQVDATKGAAGLTPSCQMVPDTKGLFKALKRTTIEDRCKAGGWSRAEVKELALERLTEASSVLVIVNTKGQARELFQDLQDKATLVYHLTTSMCAAHRESVFSKINICLNQKRRVPVICVSTSLIEAGVDVDFGSVIRYLTGLDSIAQAAGRCNRNGLQDTGQVLVINPANENLDRLPEVRIARNVAQRVLSEFRADPAQFDNDLQSPAAMTRFYQYYFFERAHEMAYPVTLSEAGRKDDLLSLLSTNRLSVEAYKRSTKTAPQHLLRQSFGAAGSAFKAIDAPTEGVVVPYGEQGRSIIAELLAASRMEERRLLLKRAQRYSVNLYPHEIQELTRRDALREFWEGSGIQYLDERYYSDEFGVSLEPVSDLSPLIV